MTTKARTCAKCNASLPPNVPGPFCPACGLTAKKQFDQQWAATVLEQAREKLRLECVASGKSELYELVKLPNDDQEGSATYAEIAARLGMTVSALKSAVSRLRARYAELLREEVARTVSSPAEVDAEIAHLLSLIGS